MLKVLASSPRVTVSPALKAGATEARPDTVSLDTDRPAPQARPPLTLPTEGSAPDGPGAPSTWTTGAKEGVGTSNTTTSKVWFTLAEGRMTEVYYPTIDKANVRDLKFMVSDGKTFSAFDTDTPNKIAVLNGDSLTFQYTTENREHGFKLTKTYITDPDRNTVMMKVDFESTTGKPLDLYVVYDPSIDNSGTGDEGSVKDGALVAHDGGVATALASSIGFQEVSTGFAGTSDGVRDLLQEHHLTHHYKEAGTGNIVQVAKITQGTQEHFTLALGLGHDEAEAQAAAAGSLQDGFEAKAEQYASGWRDYLSTLKHIDSPFSAQIKVATMALKAHEDKTFPGAFIASLSVPWGDVQDADKKDLGGYRLIWARDLYQAATAFRAIGDVDSATRACDYLFNHQQLADGSFPQNSWVDGTPYWRKVQMDQTALPIVLAWQLGKTDKEFYEKHIKPAAEFVSNQGPATPQERWEELRGLSPSTIAAEIAGLVCAADIAEKNDDPTAAHYRSKADEWQRNLKNWLVTTSTDVPHYMRINDDMDPEDGHQISLPNGGGMCDKRQQVDGGFLELVRLGIQKPDDPIIQQTIGVVDKLLKFDTPFGPAWHRYNPELDRYGEAPDGGGFRPALADRQEWRGNGRGWSFLTGERGQYEMVAGHDAAPFLAAMAGFANDGGMIPEQVWDLKNPAGTPEAPVTTLGRAARTLQENYNEVRLAGGDEKEDFITRAALQNIVDKPEYPAAWKDASRYLLADQAIFDSFDTAVSGGTPDGRIGYEDVKLVATSRPQDLVPLTLQLGMGTGAATPLAWCLAQFIRLGVNIALRQNTDMPQVVADRYVNKPQD